MRFIIEPGPFSRFGWRALALWPKVSTSLLGSHCAAACQGFIATNRDACGQPPFFTATNRSALGSTTILHRGEPRCIGANRHSSSRRAAVHWGKPPFFIAANRGVLALAAIFHRGEPRCFGANLHYSSRTAPALAESHHHQSATGHEFCQC